VVVAVPAVALRDGGGTAGPAGRAADSPASTPAPTPTGPSATPSPTGAPGPAVPGLTPPRADRIARGCALSYGGADGRSYPPGVNPSDAPTASPSRWAPQVPTPTPAPPAASPAATPAAPIPTAVPSGTTGPTAGAGPRLQDVVHVYNYVRDGAGEHALVYGPGDYLSCDVGSSPLRYNAGGSSGLDIRWLPGPIAVDGWSAAPGGPRSSIDPSVGPGYDLVEGRVTAEVTRVVVTLNGERRTIPAVNGTYLARFVHSVTWQPTGAGRPTITAYAADGHRVGSVTGFPAGCWVAPGGQVISGQAGTGCRAALPWH
jgi:hypothetical protein